MSFAYFCSNSSYFVKNFTSVLGSPLEKMGSPGQIFFSNPNETFAGFGRGKRQRVEMLLDLIGYSIGYGMT
jgi:hypothetical protein